MSNNATHSRTRATHGSAVGTRGTHGVSGYLGPIEGAAEVYEQIAIDGVYGEQNILPGAIGSGQLRDGALALSKFTQDIRPVSIVGGLPALPDVSYPVGATVVLTTDGKLYRNVADVWNKAVDGVDLVADSVTAGSISAGAISASEIAAGAIETDKLAANAVTAAKIAAGTITATEIAAGAVTTSELNASAVIQLVTNSGSTAVIDSSGLTITGGAVTVTNGYSVVIIDGTSNMFKIAASGTMARGFPSVATGSANTDVMVSGMGAIPRPCIWTIAFDNSSIGNMRLAGYMEVFASGYPTMCRAYGYVYAVSTNHVVLCAESNTLDPGYNASARYYLLVEAGI